MNKLIKSALFVSLLALGSCLSSDDITNPTGPNTEIKLVSRFVEVKNGELEDSYVGDFQYSESNKLTSIELYPLGDQQNAEKLDFKYSASGELLLVDTKYSDSYAIPPLLDLLTSNAGDNQIAKILSYEYRNPIKIQTVYTQWDKQLETQVTKLGTMDISYDTKPFFGFYTLFSAGIIDALATRTLTMNSLIGVPFTHQANEVIPATNPTKIIFKNQEEQETRVVELVYTYDEQDYPKQIMVINTENVLVYDHIKEEEVIEKEQSVINYTITYKK